MSVRCPSEEGSSATDFVTDVTDVRPMSVGRRKMNSLFPLPPSPLAMTADY
ncbi:hypothetical protein QUB70_04540 [Microcoleus sp. A003_D6]|uniref:hypothetical protein n=1 Tax=Microcoleus sp. A003_D6 TaxID=3055266 RepID=UPI002FD503FA